MRTTVNLDDHLLAESKVRARQTGQSLGDFVEEALRLRLASAQPTSDRPQIPVFTRGTGFKAGVDPSSNAALLDIVDDDAVDGGEPVDAGL
ncbi:hypothetical protein BH23ACT6_BH23ACT6_05180 [soil metagenome]